MPESIPVSNTDLIAFCDAGDIHCQAPQRDSGELIRALVRRLADNHGIADPQAVAEAVIEREQSTSTVLQNGVAVPHARIAGIERPYVAIATSREGFLFDGRTVYLALLVLIPTDKPALYLQTLRSLATVLRKDDAVRRLAAMTTAGEVMRFFQTSGLRLPSYVCAADIMTPPVVTLRDNASLKEAIDLFTENDYDEVPVVDRENDLVGVVSAGALLNVCLPNYLLWMDDLSPIRNFEPFVEVLRREHSTWLSEIMSESYASVQVASPAIEVAAEFVRRNTSHCYVLREKQLVGAISLRTFLHKIFRA